MLTFCVGTLRQIGLNRIANLKEYVTGSTGSLCRRKLHIVCQETFLQLTFYKKILILQHLQMYDKYTFGSVLDPFWFLP